jgi:hypothetical protein
MAKKKANRFRPALEALEERFLPTITLTSGFNGMVNTGWNPPDPNIAVGPNYVLETVNESYAIYSKTTGSLLTKNTLGSLFAGMDAGSGGQFDPTALYDDSAGRFVIEAQVKDSASSKAFVDIAVSNSSDPTQGFTEIHQIEVDEGGIYWTDNGKLGYNADAYVFTGNLYTFAGAYGHEVVVSIDKHSVLDQNASTLTYYQVDRASSFSMIPARMHGSVPGGPMWFVETNSGSGSYVDVVRMDNVLSNTPTFTDNNLTVNSYLYPPAAPQPGGSTVDTGDSRTLNVEWNNNYLAAAFNSTSGSDAAAAWLEFSTSGSQPALLQQGVIHPGTGIATYFPSVGVDAAGDLALTYMESSANEYPSVYVTGRLASDAPGTLEPAVRAESGTGTLLGRAGDYSGISLDPSATGTFWIDSEYGLSGTAWGTWVAQLQLSSPGGADAPPTVTTPANAGTNPVTGTSTTLSVLGADDTGESTLSYGWSTASAPSGATAPSFSINGTNAAKNTVVTFYQAGSYTFQVTITDPAGLTATSSVTVTVNQTLTAIRVSPGSSTLPNSATQQFTATAVDQFGQAVASQPSYAWSILAGAGAINGSGLYAAPASGSGNVTICAAAGTMSSTASITVASSPGAPSGLTATAASPQQANLTWGDASTNVTGFNIQRSSNGGKSWTQIAQVPGTVTSYSDVTVTKGKTYQYRVNAYNSAGTSPWSNVAPVTTPSRMPERAPGHYPAPDVPGPISLSVTATASPDLSPVDEGTGQATSGETPVSTQTAGQPAPMGSGGQDSAGDQPVSSSATDESQSTTQQDAFLNTTLTWQWSDIS